MLATSTVQVAIVVWGVDSIDPIDQSGEAQAGEEISSSFVVAGCNGSKILQAAETFVR